MIAKKQLRAAGAGYDAEVSAYYRATARATTPGDPAPHTHEYAIVRYPFTPRLPELYRVTNHGPASCVSQGLPALLNFQKIVESATALEATP